MGRTKIITVHSGIWLKNSTDRRLRFRLHVPITSLVAPSGQDATHPQLALDNMIGPLQPDAGGMRRKALWPRLFVITTDRSRVADLPNCTVSCAAHTAREFDSLPELHLGPGYGPGRKLSSCCSCFTLWSECP